MPPFSKPRFNSKLVRLKLTVGGQVITITQLGFQFQTGSIKASNAPTGSWSTISFNSKLVRLKLFPHPAKALHVRHRFNSKLVRLKHGVLDTIDRIVEYVFQFQTGSIKAVEHECNANRRSDKVSIPNWFD